uniref:HscB mitochondrial iron-sulfur cluster cochaperone n=1 Tax=Salvator merianae TaxID=96440 RepID=A0A8D0E7J0_SALMN
MWWRRALGVAFAHWRRAALPLVPAASRTSQAGAGGCWSCGEAVSAGARFCPSCRALQPPEPSPDLFALLGCERRFEVDAAELRRRFRSLQQALHPDGFASSSPQAERRLSEQHAALLNEAYETLRSPLRRGLYLLKLKGLELAPGADAEAEPGFLSEIMEISERLVEANSNTELEEMETFLAAKQRQLTKDVTEAFDQGNFQEAKKLLAKMKYFANLEESLKKKKIPR